ncbi:nucleotide-diphospho-sugar transferase [Echria macrotheca]|uniref:Mannose-1-phosphate guanyltransferase n=1 Tax=Echria macrotheca TaxID=438768 RepID=A0AAJ0BA13_9PEZI|nr:nucleotide-diphospho-sugar transferase [Echria macrotheca]
MSSKQSGRVAAASKSKKSGKSSTDEKAEDVLQAVVIADSFQDRFKPFTLEKPRCLLPLAGVPIIEYTLEALAANGVQEVYIYCGAHSEEIDNYIHESARFNPTSIISPFSTLELIRVTDATSVGDFLRDLDKRAIVSGDFIVVHGDLVTNVPLADALAKHKKRREANRDACMTMVLRSIGVEPHRAAKSRVIQPIFVVGLDDGRCLQYDELLPGESFDLDMSIPGEDYEIRADLIDCGIDICTLDILALWSESFDYELPRRNFLHGVLKDWELNGKMIYTEILDEGYACRASNLKLYDCITKDIIGRWAFPIVPESNFVHGQTFKRTMEGSCFEDGVITARGSSVKSSIIGSHSSVGDKTAVHSSVIGRRCKIGKNVTIKESYIWDDVTIEDGATIEHSIIANSAAIGKGVRVPNGTLISFRVRVGDGQKLPENPPARISLLTEGKMPSPTDASLVGPEGIGSLYQEPVDEDEDEEDDQKVRAAALEENSLMYSLGHLSLSSLSISTLASQDAYDSDGESNISGSPGPGVSSPGRLSPFEPDAFHGDAVHGLVDALRADDNEDFDSAKLEFMGLRLANNASDASMRRAIAVAFAHRAAELMSPEHGGLEPTKAAERAFTAKKGAVKFISEVGVGGDSKMLQAEFALALQKALLGIKGLEVLRAGALLAAMLQQLYNLDVLEEDGILTWWADKRAGEDDNLNKVKEKCRVLVDWLENADEEDDDDDEDEDDSD